MMVEVNPSGHRLVYLRILVEEAVRRGLAVTLALGHAVLTDDRFDLHLGDLRSKVEVVTIKSKPSVGLLQRLATSTGSQLVLISDGLPFGRNLLQGLRYRRPLLRIVIMNDPRWWLEGASGLLFKRRLTALFLAIADLRSGQELYWLRHQGYQGRHDRAVIDPLIMDANVADIQNESKAIRGYLGMSDEVYWFGCVGALDRRKNLKLVAEALKLVQLRSGHRVGMALIGPWVDEGSSSDFAQLMRRWGLECVVDDRHLTNSEMNASVAALDCVVLAYSTVAPNSTVPKAAALGVRCAVAGSPSFRRFAADVTGRPGVELNVRSLADEMQACLLLAAPALRKMRGVDAFTGPLLSDLKGK